VVLNDIDLRRMIKELVGHDDMSFVNPASIDIRVGNTVMRENAWDEDQVWERIQLEGDRTIYLAPKEPCLIATMEVITIPNGYVGCVFLKSSRAREGYDHALAGWIDPGWSGIITLEIRNILKHHSIPIYRGLKIAQLIVIKCSGPSDFPYSGKYKGAQEVMASYHGSV